MGRWPQRPTTEVTLTDTDPTSPLAHALLAGDYKTADALVSGPAQPRELLLAINAKRKATVKKMLAAGTRADGLVEGRSALHALADGPRDAALAAALIAAGAPVDALDPYGRTALHMVVHHKCPELIAVLAAAGAVDQPCGALPHNTALHMACASKTGVMTSVEADNAIQLLQLGASPHARNADGMTPLQLAAQYGRLEVIRALFDHGATVGECTGFAPLHLAAGRDEDGLFELLLAQGDQLEGRSALGATPLLTAARKSLAAARRLIALGADRAATMPDGSDAPAVARMYGRADIAAALA
jgi:ankyrin repeat protein